MTNIKPEPKETGMASPDTDQIDELLFDPKLQEMMMKKIEEENERKAWTGFDRDQEDFPSLLDEQKVKAIHRDKTFETNDWTKSKSKNFLDQNDHFEGEALKIITDTFPLLPKKIVKFAYYQLGDTGLTVELLKSKYSNFYNFEADKRISGERMKNSKLKDQTMTAAMYNSGHQRMLEKREEELMDFRTVNGQKNMIHPNKADKINLAKNDYTYNQNAEYTNVRAEERRYAKLMVHMFKSAAAAYARGDNASVKRYRDLGNKYKQLFHEIKTRSADQMFSKVNQQLNPDDVIDLHGLHKEEAVSKLANHLEVLFEKVDAGTLPQSKTFKVITGKGNNSKEGKAVIRPRVHQFLTQEGYRFKDGGDGGSFIISIS